MANAQALDHAELGVAQMQIALEHRSDRRESLPVGEVQRIHQHQHEQHPRAIAAREFILGARARLLDRAHRPNTRLGVGLEECLLVLRAHGHGILRRHLLGLVLIGIVHGIHDAVRSQRGLAELDRRFPGHSRKGDVDVALEIAGDRQLKRLQKVIAAGADARGMHVVQAIGPIRQGFAAVADDEFQLREPIEHAHDDQAQQVQSGVDAEAEYRAVQSALEQRTDEALGRSLRDAR